MGAQFDISFVFSFLPKLLGDFKHYASDCRLFSTDRNSCRLSRSSAKTL